MIYKSDGDSCQATIRYCFYLNLTPAGKIYNMDTVQRHVVSELSWRGVSVGSDRSLRLAGRFSRLAARGGSR